MLVAGSFISCSKDDINSSEYYWYNKRIVWLGTSISENYNGHGASLTKKIENSYPNILGKLLRCDVINKSTRGLASALDPDGTIQKYGSLCATIDEYQNPILNNENQAIVGGNNNRNIFRTYENALLHQNADVYVFDLVPNNESFDTNEWENFDFETHTFYDMSSFKDNRKTYLGSILFLYNELMLENPSAKIIFVTTYKTEHPGVQNTIIAHNQLNVPMIDLRNLINNRGDTYTTVDGIHPTQRTVDIMAEILAQEFRKIDFR